MLSIVLGPVAIPLAGRTPNLFWCDLLLVAFLGAELLASLSEPESGRYEARFLGLFVALVVAGAATLVFTRDVLVGVATLKLRVFPILSLLYVRIWARRFGGPDRLWRWSVILLGLLALQIIWSFNEALRGGGALAALGEDVASAKDIASTAVGRSNYLASFLVLLIPIATAGLAPRERPAFRLWSLVALLAATLALVLTQSRGAILALLLGGALALALDLWDRASSGTTWRPSRRWLLGVGGMVAVVALLASAVLDEAGDGPMSILVPPEAASAMRATTEFLLEQWREGNLSANRQSIWQEGLRHLPDSPLVGIGLGNQALMMDELRMESTTHNLFLDTALEQGAVGLALLLALLAAAGLEIWRTWRREADPALRPSRLALLTAFAVALLNAFGEPSFWGPQYGILFWMLVGGATAGPAPETETRWERSPSSS